MGFALGVGATGRELDRSVQGSWAVSPGHAYWHARATPPILELYLGTVTNRSGEKKNNWISVLRETGIAT